MKNWLKNICLIFVMLIFCSTNCDPHHSFNIVNNTQDTLFILFHNNKAILDTQNTQDFRGRFHMVIPNDSVDFGSNSPILNFDHFLIVVDDDTLSKYATFEDVVRLKKYKEIYFSKDSLNNMKCIVISEEMIK